MGSKIIFGLGKIIFFLAFLFLIVNNAEAATYSTVQYENRFDGKWYLTTQTLTKAKSPYLIFGGCAIGSVPSYATVTIEAGVVVKFDFPKYCYGGTIWGGLTVYGNLLVNGTESDPVIFTSYYDDSVGGDFDVSATVPQPGDWGDINLSPGVNNNILIEHAVFRYGGHRLSQLSVGKVYNETNIILRNLDISKSGVYGFSSAMPTTIVNSRFHDNGAGAIYGDIFWNPQITAINNWWGSDTGPTVVTNPGGTGEKIFGNILYDPWVGKDINVEPILSFPSGDIDGVGPGLQYLPEQPTFRVIYNDENGDEPAFINVVVGSSTYAMRVASSTASGTEYIFTPEPGTFQKDTYIFHFEASDGKASVRLPAAGGIDPVFGIRNRPVILVPGILGSEQKNGVWVLDPILHTYDNLMETFRANGFKDGEDLFSFPYQWRQSNILTAVQLKQKIDEVKIISRSNKVNIVAHSMGGLVTRQYAQSDKYENDIDQLIFLGTPHLGAPKAYLMYEGGELAHGFSDSVLKALLNGEARDLGYKSLFEYINKFPINSISELLPIFDYLKESGAVVNKIYPQGYPRNIFLENLNFNNQVISNLNIRLTNIVGSLINNNTIHTIRVIKSVYLPLWVNGYPENYYAREDDVLDDFGLEYGLGDGTVPKQSAEFIKNNLLRIASEHSRLPDNSALNIISILQNKDNPNLVNKDYFPNLKMIIIKILSPADIVVVAPDGKRVGKDFTTGQEFNEIDGAFYSGFETDNEFVTIPNPIDGSYRIETQGTGSGGEYTIVAGFIENATTSEREFTGNILPEQITGVDVYVDTAQNNIVSMIPLDQIPPKIEILSPNFMDYPRSANLPVVVTTTDLESGVFSQEISLDGTMIQNGEVVDLFYKKLGDHQIIVSSTDFQNNLSVSSTKFRIIATVSSTVQDIQRAYLIGWIKNKKIVQELIEEVKENFSLNKHKDKGTHCKSEKLDMKKENHIKDIYKDLEKYLRKKYINKQAHDLLMEDIEWLINN